MNTDAELVAKLTQAGITLATVESCTGGLIAHRITDVAGSSATFWGGYVTYDNRAKIELGVAPETIQKFGAVSQEVASEMAFSAWKKVGATFSSPPPLSPIYIVATTGIAGPGGGTEKKPVGLCCIALAWGDNPIKTIEVRAPQTLGRSETKRFFADRALELVLGALK